MKIIVANWKMNLGIKESISLLHKADKICVAKKSKNQVVICPSHLALGAIAVKNKVKNVVLGAQDVALKEVGALTGGVSAANLKEAGVKYVIIGHSERRGLLGETDEMISKKIKLAIQYGLTPILCVGETKRELRITNYELRTIKKHLSNQLTKALSDIPNSKFQTPNSILVAYEPVWALSTTKDRRDCSVEEAIEIMNFIRHSLNLKSEISNLKLLYGGSVNPQNSQDFLSRPEIDGVLVGGASTKFSEFKEILSVIPRSSQI